MAPFLLLFIYKNRSVSLQFGNKRYTTLVYQPRLDMDGINSRHHNESSHATIRSTLAIPALYIPVLLLYRPNFACTKKFHY